MKTKQKPNRLLIAATIAVTITLVTGLGVILFRLDDQALAVLAGALCGAGTAIPTALLLYALDRSRRVPYPLTHHQPTYQPPILIAPTMPQMMGDHRPPATFETVNHRQFTVVGDDD